MAIEGTRTTGAHSTAQAHLDRSLTLGRFPPQSHAERQLKRKQTAPAMLPVNHRHLDEFSSRESVVPSPSDARPPGSQTAPLTHRHSIAPTAIHRPFNEPLSIKPMRLSTFLSDGVALYISHVLHPSRIPGNDMFSKVYAMGVLPVLIIAMTVIQWGIGLLVIMVNHTRMGAYYYDIFFKDQIALFDETDFVDPEGHDEAVRQLNDRTPRESTQFSYHIANMLLTMSSMAYQRDDKLVAEASKILLDVKDQAQRDKAAGLLQESERVIDENASREFGMRFMGISELKTLGGPFAGLFYNDDTIVLVFKGTSVLAFNEYLIDVTIQRVDASEFLYGEVHKGFYESLFPDPIPLNWYENMTYDKTNPFKTIMETIFEVAKVGKSKTGKPVNLWLTGHSLGGGLAALTMARLQMMVKEDDPLMSKDNEDNEDNKDSKDSRDMDNKPNKSHSSSTDKGGVQEGLRSRTVLEEMLARFSDDPELLVLRDCYTVASPKLGDSDFADEFARNHLHYCSQSPYKPTYWRIVADMDLVPRLPPGLSVDRGELYDCLLPRKFFPEPKAWLKDAKQHGQQQGQQQDQQQKAEQEEGTKKPIKHLHSLLDYQHVGQLVKVHNAAKVPTVKPSAFEANLCKGVLRTKDDKQALMMKLVKAAASWQVEDQIESTLHSSFTSNPDSTKTTATITSTTKVTTTTMATDDEQQTLAAKAQQIADDITKAQELHDTDELCRLRQPSLIERFLLRIPSLLSHAPATYQRNLIRARFYFKSFPGTDFEERQDRWLEQVQAEELTQDVDEGVDMASSDDEQTQERQHVNLDTPVNVNVDDDVEVLMERKSGTSYSVERRSHKTSKVVVATMTRRVSMLAREE